MIGRVILKQPYIDQMRGLTRFVMTQVTEGGISRFVFFQIDRSRMPGIAWLRVK